MSSIPSNLNKPTKLNSKSIKLEAHFETRYKFIFVVVINFCTFEYQIYTISFLLQ